MISLTERWPGGVSPGQTALNNLVDRLRQCTSPEGSTSRSPQNSESKQPGDLLQQLQDAAHALAPERKVWSRPANTLSPKDGIQVILKDLGGTSSNGGLADFRPTGVVTPPIVDRRRPAPAPAPGAPPPRRRRIRPSRRPPTHTVQVDRKNFREFVQSVTGMEGGIFVGRQVSDVVAEDQVLAVSSPMVTSDTETLPVESASMSDAHLLPSPTGLSVNEETSEVESSAPEYSSVPDEKVAVDGSAGRAFNRSERSEGRLGLNVLMGYPCDDITDTDQYLLNLLKSTGEVNSEFEFGSYLSHVNKHEEEAGYVREEQMQDIPAADSPQHESYVDVDGWFI